jgi:hypothetical protein
MSIEPKSRWTHKYQHYSVIIVGLPTPQVKDANDANWQPAVAYHQEDNAGDSMTFVRPEKDFLAKFVPEAKS